MSTITDNRFMGIVTQYDTTCAEHCSPATFTLEINGVLIPLCQTCLDELNETLKSHATGNNIAENNTAATNLDELRVDMRAALKIINSDIGMKNSILAQCNTENPETKESVDAMRRSIADGEHLLTKYSDGRL